MNQKGLDYNTQRPALLMPEYGREIQKMVDYAINLPTKEERQQCANTIVNLMMTKTAHPMNVESSLHAVWNHLYMMSGKQLDIDWPYDMTEAEKVTNKPQQIPLTKKSDRVHIRHYGHLVEELLEKLKTMPEGEELDELVRITANQMKRDLLLWGQGSAEDDRVYSDMERYTDGRIHIDENNFKFDTIRLSNDERDAVNKKKRKK